MGRQDVVVIGSGPNSLVAAFYLARGGRRVVVVERRDRVGGIAVTDEFHPGFRVSSVLHACGPLRPGIAADMQLDHHGLTMLEADTRVFAPSPDGRALLLHGDPNRSMESIARFSKKDAERWPAYQQALQRVTGPLSDLLEVTPPDIDRPGISDLLALLRTGRQVRDLARADLYRLLRWGPMAVADLVAEWFDTELLRAALAGRGIFAACAGPWSAGTAAVLLLRAAADPHAAGSVSVPRGGMGALTEAMAAAARAAGASIRTGHAVTRIETRDGAVEGLVLEGGERIETGCVVSGLDPKRTLLDLVGPLHLDPDFVQKLAHVRMRGVTAKVNLALSRLPSFTALGGTAAGTGPSSPLAGRILIGHEIDTLERAFDASKYGETSQEPWLEALCPTVLDPSLAPDGRHVLSVHVQYAPYHLKEGTWDDARRKDLGDRVVRTLAAHAPDLPGLIEGGQVITPKDLEETYGLTEGHLFHGEEALDQVFTMRPLLGWARYRTPVRGLYLCGAGTHPGGTVTGASGRNAAREVLTGRR
ncbi:MAG TPA: NAD(P)/FAD-dependent oxidoreductase [Candidatus Cryosericum sp.]|nr:NAD(P)/FAD-dependent oxidoreductase [Candidatus Cryosericum sp.]